jgi:hypothetical protein
VIAAMQKTTLAVSGCLLDTDIDKLEEAREEVLGFSLQGQEERSNRNDGEEWNGW